MTNTVAFRVPGTCRLAIRQRQVNIPHKRSGGRFKVPILFNCCLDDQGRSAGSDLQ
jgi:hypothetical protein